MHDTNKVAVALIMNDEQKFLFIKPSNYKNFGKYQDAWYPPTGHIKINETVESALIREVKEELNLDVQPINLISEWEQDVPGEKAYWWNCKIISGTIRTNEEISEYRYFTKEEIKNLKLWPETIKFFTKFIWQK